MSCFDARQMETCYSGVTRDVVVIYTLHCNQKRNLKHFDHVMFVFAVKNGNCRWKPMTAC